MKTGVVFTRPSAAVCVCLDEHWDHFWCSHFNVWGIAESLVIVKNRIWCFDFKLKQFLFKDFPAAKIYLTVCFDLISCLSAPTSGRLVASAEFLKVRSATYDFFNVWSVNGRFDGFYMILMLVILKKVLQDKVWEFYKHYNHLKFVKLSTYRPSKNIGQEYLTVCFDFSPCLSALV